MKKSLIALACLLSVSAYADTVSIPMFLTATPNQPATSVGYVVAEDTQYGLMLTPHLNGLIPTLSAGPHGFHIHENPSCDNGGIAAGGHLDPKQTGHHFGPYGKGHLGDLPVLSVAEDGTATTPVVAPRLKVKDILNHSLMIHQGGDNYSDNPPMGGGGARMVCGVIPAKAA